MSERFTVDRESGYPASDGSLCVTDNLHYEDWHTNAYWCEPNGNRVLCVELYKFINFRGPMYLPDDQIQEMNKLCIQFIETEISEAAAKSEASEKEVNIA